MLVSLGIGTEGRIAGPAMAQDEVRNYRKPILTVETGGHHARVRSLVWNDDFTLLSGGEDKVIKVWDFHDGARLSRTIRPPVWRGPAGTIYAMAVTRPDAQGQSFLAVGGYGVENRRGDITIFRIPGLQRTPTGEIVARLLPPENDDPRLIGHRNSVLCLAFDPSGRFLASGGHDGQTTHQTVILWEREGVTFRPRTALGESNRIGEVRALSFSPAGGHLATGGVDGALRLWDVNQGIQVGIGLPRDNTPINALAFSPDGRFIVVGHEGGGLFRFDVANLGQADPARFATAPGQGPVESLAYSPDGRLLAVGIKSDRADSIEPMAIACDLEIRAMPVGDILQRRRVSGLIYASTFSPRGERLAYSAGTAQAIYLQDPANLEQPAEQLRGQGSTTFDLGFSADSQVVGFTRTPFDPTRPPPVYDGFDFGRRKYRAIRRQDLRLALKTYDGWSLEGSISRYVLDLVNLNGRRTRLDLDRTTERNWWSWTFVPPGPGHARPAVAIGCESGVVIYDLETGRRTRAFAGHSGPAVSLAPSPDGRWLASSSLDQTIMLYSLDECDTRPAFGATLHKRPDLNWVVTRVEPKKFAAAMGLLPGDMILRAGIARGQSPATFYNNETLAEFVGAVDELRPALDTIALWVRRTVWIPSVGAYQIQMPPMPSTKRNNAAISLILGADKEWVMWTPEGFYDTSIEGDSRFLGWHINADYRLTQPTDFYPIVTYSKALHRPSLLDRLWQRVDVAQPKPPEVYSDQPPRIVFTSVEAGIRLPAPGVVWVVNVPRPSLSVDISGDASSTVAQRRVIFDENVLELAPLAAPRPRITERLQVDLVPKRRVRLAVQAANQNGKQRTETIDLVYIPPPDKPQAVPPTSPRLIVLTIGNEKPQNPRLLPSIPYADRDALDLAEFLSEHLVSSDGARGRQNQETDRIALTGEKAFARSVNQRLDQLEQRLQSKQFQKGDIVAVMITAHILEFDSGARIATPDTQQGREPIPAPMIMARDISDLLGRLADYGCRVMVFLDGVHELPDSKFKSDIKSWVRELQRERRVITFVASKEGPSGVDNIREHRLFALSILDVFQGAGAAAARKDRKAAMTLEQFRKALHQGVQDLSGRMQEADAFIPIEIDARTLFAQP